MFLLHVGYWVDLRQEINCCFRTGASKGWKQNFKPHPCPRGLFCWPTFKIKICICWKLLLAILTPYRSLSIEYSEWICWVCKSWCKTKCSNNHHTKFNDCKIYITVNFNLYVLRSHDMIVLLRLIIILFAVHAICKIESCIYLHPRQNQGSVP